MSDEVYHQIQKQKTRKIQGEYKRRNDRKGGVE